MQISLEQACKNNLLACASTYARHRGIKFSTLGRHVVNDTPFFSRLSDDGKSFTVRKYDEVLGWFASNWPADLAWPADVPHPSAANIASPDNTTGHTGGSSLHPIVDNDQSLQPSGVAHLARAGFEVERGDEASSDSLPEGSEK